MLRADTRFLSRLLACASLLLPSLAAAAAPDILAAVRSGDAARVEQALEGGADVNARDDWGRTPLLVATQLRHTPVIRLLLLRKPDVNAANRNDITPLIAAAQTGNEEAVKLLLAAGAEPNRGDNLGWTALMWARSRNREAIAKLLLDAGADPSLAAARPAESAPPRTISPSYDFQRIVGGNPDGWITIYEYTDFQCPYCAHGAKVLREVMTRYEGQVRLVVKHLPLPQLHPMAMAAAHHFEALAMQDAKKAWAFYDRIFANTQALSGGEAYLRKVAAEAGADMARLDQDLKGGMPAARVAADLKESASFRFDGVPVFVVNGRVIEGAQPAETFARLIDSIR